jgi:hypothetical protein
MKGERFEFSYSDFSLLPSAFCLLPPAFFTNRVDRGSLGSLRQFQRVVSRGLFVPES